MKKYLKKVQDLIEEVKGIIEDESYYPDHHERMLEVNVKLHRLDFLDNDDICEAIDKNKYGKLMKEQKEQVKEQWLEKKPEDEWEGQFQYFISDQYDYFKQVLGGCTNNSNKHYQEQIMQAQMSIDTCYPHINKIKDVKGRIKELRKWQKKDVLEKKYYDEIDIKEVGCYGRGGGHLCYYPVRDLENPIEELEGLIEESFDEDLCFKNEEVMSMLKTLKLKTYAKLTHRNN